MCEIDAPQRGLNDLNEGKVVQCKQIKIIILVMRLKFILGMQERETTVGSFSAGCREHDVPSNSIRQESCCE